MYLEIIFVKIGERERERLKSSTLSDRDLSLCIRRFVHDGTLNIPSSPTSKNLGSIYSHEGGLWRESQQEHVDPCVQQQQQ